MKILKFFICPLILLFPLLIYTINFGHYDISNNPEKWAHFGDYIGGVYSVVLTGFLTYMMYKINKADEQKREKRELAKKLLHLINKFSLSDSNLGTQEVDEFRFLIIDNEFIINNERQFIELLRIADYYVSLCVDINNRDYSKEAKIKDIIKNTYNGV